MPILSSLKQGLPRQVIPVLLASGFALAGPAMLRAASIEAGDVTTLLGPTFFVDDASNGGTDTDINQPTVAAYNRFFDGLLTRNQGPTRVTLTGFGFAAHTSAVANDASSVAVTFTYLGKDEALNGGDDVILGTATGNYVFTVGGEYAFAFDTPLSADLMITGTRFRIQIAPTNGSNNGSLKLKTGALAYETAASVKLSVAGVATAQIIPQRLNLAKFQAVTAGSVAGQRLASYVTDGVAGNDNRWQSENWAWNTARVDFPFPVEVGSAHVFTGVDDTLPVGNFSVQYLNGSTWVTIPGASVSGNTNVERNLVFTNPITASSFRLIGQDSPLRIREMALYPPNGPGGFPLGTDVTINLAYQRPAIASNSTTGNHALKAVDGRAHVGSFWQSDTPGTNTLDVDLRVSTKIGSVHLYSGSGGVAPLSEFVLKQWNGTTWLDIPGGSVTGNTNGDLVVPFNTPVTTSKVRIEFNNSGTTTIRELCVFPANTGNAGYPLGTNIIESGSIAQFETYNDSFYLVTHPTSGRFMYVPNNGQPSLDQSGLSAGQGQYQVLLNHSNGTYRLRNRASGSCLSGAGLSKNPGLPLTDTPYSALPHQDWILDPLGAGKFRIINQWSGLVIDTQGASTAAGTILVQNASNHSPSQSWEFSKFAGYPKKGIGGTSFAMATNPQWAYNWGRSNSNSLPVGATYFPMQWGNFSWDIGSNQGPIWQEYPAWRRRGDGIHLLGFNEPDRSDQSNMSLSSVISLWPRLMELDLPLVSPAPGTPSWLDPFYTQAADLGFRVDYTAIHNYPGPSSGSSNILINSITDSYNSWNRPVWLTEFSFVDWAGNQSWSEEDNYNCLAEFLWRAESVSELRKYALFVFTEDANNPQPTNAWQAVTPAPRSNSYDINGNLTAFGKLYVAWDSDTTVRMDKSYHIHNKNTRKRIANLTTQSNLAGRNIRVDGDFVKWTLASAGASNRYHVVSSLDGRRLSSNGTTVSLVAAGTTGTAVEWSLTESQHGWYYLGHPATSKRLNLVYNNSNFVATYSMVANTVTDDAAQWRFIVPWVANTAPVLAAIPPQSINQGSLLTFTASAADADVPANTLSYSLVGAPPGAAIHAGTGVFTWTPNETQVGTIFNFTVRVSDGNQIDEEQVSVTVNDVNSTLVLSAISPQTVDEGVLLNFTASVTNPGIPANTLDYSLISAPTGASIDPSTGVFSWTPTEAQGPGAFNFTVRVSDGSLIDDEQVAVAVNEVNAAPVLAMIPAQTVSEGSLLTFTASATDTDLPTNTITYSLIGAPLGASIDGGTGVFTWTPGETQGPGTFNFTVRASDGNLTNDQPVTVNVTDDNGNDILPTWILSGQSNAEGYGITENPISGLAPSSTLSSIGRSDLNVTHNNIQMFQGANDSNAIASSAGASLPPRDTWHAMTAQEGLAFDWGSGRGNESRRRFGPELAFGYDVQQQLGAPIALIKYARGSSSIAPSTAQSGGAWRDYDPSDGGRLNQYDKLVSTIQAAVNSLPAGQVLKLRGVLWMQGESDATATNASAYQANLAELIAALRADIGAIAAASGGKLTRSAASWSELDVFIGTVQNSNASRQTVINAQNAVAAADANVFTVNGTTGLSVMTFDDWGDSGVHYDTAGQVQLGERFADAVISRIDSGVLISESGGSTSVTEGSATDTYTVTLTREPSADVTISITTDTQVSVFPASLTFTTGNWSTPQTVTVTAVNDAVIEPVHSGMISHGLTSSDLSFGGLPIDGVSVIVTDNDANVAPVLAAIPSQTVNEGSLLTFTGSATDGDVPADTLIYSLIGAPSGASIHSDTGVFTWTPTEGQGPGSFNFTVRVSDGILTDEQVVIVTVQNVLPSPVIDQDGDGLSDLLEYAFATDPGTPNGSPFRVTAANAGTVSLEFPWNWQAVGLTWQIRHGNDLSNRAGWSVVSPGATTITREGNIDRITISPAMDYPGRGFYVLEVIGN